MAKPAVDLRNAAQAIAEALALHQAGRLDEAERIYARLLKAKRDHFDALHLLGMLNFQRGRTGEAFRLLSAALRSQPNSADAHANFAMVLHALKRDQEALASLDRALVIAPGHVEALNNRGTLLLAMQRPAEALATLNQLLASEPRHVQALVNRGNAHSELGNSEVALADYDAAIALAPSYPAAHYNRGNALRAIGRGDDAIAAYDRVLALLPDHVAAAYNRGLTLASLNRHEAAVESLNRVVAAVPDHADAHFALAQSQLTLGDYRQGFREYEWRWRRTGMSPRRASGGRTWLGDVPLANRTLLLQAEQGLGDTIQFARYVPALVRAGARVILEVQPELKALMQGVAGASAVFARGETLPAYDLQCPMGSLPLAFKTELSSVPAEIPYLQAPGAKIEQWRSRIESRDGPLVALAWAGRAAHVNDRNRSLPLSALLPLLSLDGPGFVSVQRDLRPGEADVLAAEPRIADLGAELSDFTDTAAVLAHADLLISVDTAVAHLAGALGRPTWLLLPFQPDWRWTLRSERSPWYPQIRLFRQASPGDWDGVVARLREALASATMAAT